MPNWVAVDQTVWASVGGPKKFLGRWAPPLRIWVCLTPRNTLIPTGVTTANLVGLALG